MSFEMIRGEIHMVKVVIYHLSIEFTTRVVIFFVLVPSLCSHHFTAISAKNKIYHLSGKLPLLPCEFPLGINYHQPLP